MPPKNDIGQIIESTLMSALVLAKDIFAGFWYFLFRPVKLGLNLRDRSEDAPGSTKPLAFLVVAWLIAIWSNRAISVPIDRWFGDSWYNQVSTYILINPPSLSDLNFWSVIFAALPPLFLCAWIAFITSRGARYCGSQSSYKLHLWVAAYYLGSLALVNIVGMLAVATNNAGFILSETDDIVKNDLVVFMITSYTFQTVAYLLVGFVYLGFVRVLAAALDVRWWKALTFVVAAYLATKPINLILEQIEQFKQVIDGANKILMGGG